MSKRGRQYLKAVNLRIIFITFAVTLVLTLGAQRVLYHQRVVDPLERRIESIPGVVSAQITDTGRRRGVTIELAPDADFKDTFRAARDMALGGLGNAFAGLEVQDNRDQRLKESFYRMHFYVQQGIATGQFTAMAEGICDIAHEERLTQQQVFVAEDAVYVHLSHGEYHLYEIIGRPSQSGAVIG